MPNDQNQPTAFISYCWESEDHKLWVRNLATRLRHDGVDVKLDQWEMAPGAQVPHFMETAVRENDFVLIICTPKYKEKSDARLGGVGYEGDIMTAEVIGERNHRKFIPVLLEGTDATALPSWLKGKYRVDLRGTPYDEAQYEDLHSTLLGNRPSAPPVGKPPEVQTGRASISIGGGSPEPLAPIKIVGVIVDEVTQPKNDGTPGSALYRVPFRLSRRPSADWARAFGQTWDRPPRFTMMHRPGIARVVGDMIILDGTTIEEVEKYHRETLILCVQRTNEIIDEFEAKEVRDAEDAERQRNAHQQRVRDVAKDISFD
ncbi:MAG: toll/interleukin-1 receptor domain-containing protein [Fimbriimonadaceae bacterium]|nr:toll/interleukin-1 receptor domain-containing protein [Fimbriimonadaceae bacterium]